MQHQDEKYACLMLSLSIKKWDSLQCAINRNDLWVKEDGFGNELYPHVTILYGFHPSVNPVWIKDCVYRIKNPIIVELNSISHFSTPLYDVLKFDVNSEKLRKLHEIFSKFPHTDTYPEYNPHVTLAYVKSGMAEKYNRKLNKPIKLKSNTFRYSIPNGNSYEWSNDKQIRIKRNKFYPSEVGSYL